MKRISTARVVLLATAWWALAAPAAADAWIVGGFAVLVGALLHGALGGGRRVRIRLKGLAVFLPFYLNAVLRGGFDVSRRALAPALPVAPGLLPYRIRLEDGPARVFFVNAISLMPGTFSADLSGERLTVHLLADDGRVEARIRALEERVAALFDLRLADHATERDGERRAPST